MNTDRLYPLQKLRVKTHKEFRNPLPQPLSRSTGRGELSITLRFERDTIV